MSLNPVQSSALFLSQVGSIIASKNRDGGAGCSLNGTIMDLGNTQPHYKGASARPLHFKEPSTYLNQRHINHCHCKYQQIADDLNKF